MYAQRVIRTKSVRHLIVGGVVKNWIGVNSMTNFEKIKSMDTIELSKFINNYACADCFGCVAYPICNNFIDVNCVQIIEEWLKMESN